MTIYTQTTPYLKWQKFKENFL